MNTIERDFLRFHAENPHVYAALRNRALSLRAQGRTFYGIGKLFEDLRFNSRIETTDPNFKMNHDYRAYYSRLLMCREPLLDGFFRTRVQKSQVQFDPWLVAP